MNATGRQQAPRRCLQRVRRAVSERIAKRSGVEFRGHDLQRTAASLMVGAGVPRLVVSKILNLWRPALTGVYDRHSYDAEKRAALDSWGRWLEAILANERDSNVVTFRPRM